MKLGDIYVNKENKEIIQIDSFASHMNELGADKLIIIFSNIEKHSEFEIGSSPCFNGYGTQEEIESKYDLLIPQEKLNKYSDWNEIFELAKLK